MAEQRVTVKKLSSGYYLLRGNGPCNWAQVPRWPTFNIREHAFPEASEAFIRAAEKLAQRTP